MSEYKPDRWVLVKLEPQEDPKLDTYYRVFATWYGGFVHGESWKLSSGVESSSLKDNFYSMPQSSGSTYICHKGSYGTSGWSFGVLSNIIDKSKDFVKITILKEKDALLLLEKMDA